MDKVVIAMTRTAKYTIGVGIVIVVGLIVANVIGVLTLRNTFSESLPLRFVNQTGGPLRNVQISITWDNPELHLERWFSTVESGEIIEIEPDTVAYFPKDWRGTCRVHDTVRKVYMIR